MLRDRQEFVHILWKQCVDAMGRTGEACSARASAETIFEYPAGSRLSSPSGPDGVLRCNFTFILRHCLNYTTRAARDGSRFVCDMASVPNYCQWESSDDFAPIRRDCCGLCFCPLLEIICVCGIFCELLCLVNERRG